MKLLKRLWNFFFKSKPDSDDEYTYDIKLRKHEKRKFPHNR